MAKVCEYCSRIEMNGDTFCQDLIAERVNLGILGGADIQCWITLYHKKPTLKCSFDPDIKIFSKRIKYCPMCGKDLDKFIKEHCEKGGQV